MIKKYSRSMNRREFFKSCARYGVLGGLALLAWPLLRRGRASVRENCISDGICTRCGALRECGLPQALSAKQGLRQ